jgi:hypothetical protein
MFNFNVLWTITFPNMKGLTKWDSKVPIAKRSILVLRLSIYLQIIQIKAHSLEVSKKRNAALTTGLFATLGINGTHHINTLYRVP